MVAPMSVKMPDGHMLNLVRPRSDGPLAEDELAYCREHDISLAYDPVSYGWVCSECFDDVTPRELPHSFSSQATMTHEATPGFETEAWFTRALSDCYEKWRGQSSTRSQLLEALWRLPELALERAQSYKPMPHTNQLRLFCRLQQQVALSLHQAGLAQDLILQGSDKTRELERKYTFRPWAEADLERYLELLDNPRIWQYLPGSYPNPLTRADARELIEVSNTLPTTHEVNAVLCDGEIVGQVRLQFEGSPASPGPGEKDAEISYWLGEDYWGRGLMSEIIRLYTLHSFEKHQLASLSAWVDKPNHASIRVLEKSGYRYIGDGMSSIAKGPEFPVYRAFRYQLD